jgi:hypothetical protein
MTDARASLVSFGWVANTGCRRAGTLPRIYSIHRLSLANFGMELDSGVFPPPWHGSIRSQAGPIIPHRLHFAFQLVPRHSLALLCRGALCYMLL